MNQKAAASGRIHESNIGELEQNLNRLTKQHGDLAKREQETQIQLDMATKKSFE